jgi:predicted AAA+ superfamily ATPase
MFVALELQKSFPFNSMRQLYFWQRESKSSTAEVDFVVQIGDKIIPVEVKSGNSGKMQSMWRFLNEKQSEYGIRISLENFAEYDKIKVVPLYATGSIMK